MNGLLVAAPFALLVALAPSVWGQDHRENRTCSPAAFPKALPSADAIVNTAALERAITADSASRPSAGVTFSVRFTKSGQGEWVKPIGVTEPDGHARLQALVAAHTRPQAAAKEPWNVRLQVVGGDSLRYVVSRSHACAVEQAPSATTGALGTVLAMASMEDIRALRQGGEARAVVEVGPTGQILNVDLVRSSGSRIQDDVLLQGAREARYLPAVVDGIPVVGRFEYRTRVRTRTTRTRVN